MECEGNEQLPESLMFKDFRDPETPQVWRPEHCGGIRSVLPHEIDFKTRHFINANNLRKPFYLRSRSRLKISLEDRYHDRLRPSMYRMSKQYPKIDHADFLNQNETFDRRKITTIQEEVFHYKRCSRPKNKVFRVKTTTYKEKVASLKVSVERLKEISLAKPDALQNKLPEDVMKLFSKIQI